MVVRHLVPARAVSGLRPHCLRPQCLRPRCLQTAHHAYSTHTPDDLDAAPATTFADKWQREFRAGVGLDSPEAATPTATTTTTTTPPTATPSIADQFLALKQQQNRLDTLGAAVAPHYQPHTLLTHPPAPADVTLELLLAAEAHQGHATSLWNPANARYIHGIRQGIHIISLEATAAHLRRAAKVVHEVSRRGGIVLFVGTRDGQDRAVARAAELAKGCHLFERWIPGSITNGKQILGKCRTKVVNEHDVDVPGFDEQLYDRPVLKPDLVVCLNPLENYVLLHECALNNIPTIGVIDTNADPTWVTYPIPANDDSLRCIQVIAGVLGRAGEAGQKDRLAAAARGYITFRAATGLTLRDSEADAAAARQQQHADFAHARADRTDAVESLARQHGVVLSADGVVLSGDGVGNADPAAVDAEVQRDADVEARMEDVRNGEGQRVKGGRGIGFSD